jgi:Bacterial membrane protein YfhO
LKTAASFRTQSSGLWPTFIVLSAAVIVLLWGNFLPDQTQFSNDGPLGRLMSECHRLPERFFGCWQDLNAAGYREGSAVPSITFALQWLLGPIWFSKLYAPIALMLLGLSAWYFFRQMGLTHSACTLGGLAAVLNSSFFSAACWGVESHVIAIGMTFLALGLLTPKSGLQGWLRTGLAGLAVGMGVSEGADIGAIFSIFVGAFVVYQAFVTEGGKVKNLGFGASRLALVAMCAALLAAQAMSELVANDIKGIAGTQQDAKTKSDRWDWATQWSLPKAETLRLVVPGLFGYRDDTREGGRYWGSIGRAAEWDRYVKAGQQGPPPKGFIRYSGGGFYAGVGVVLLAVWAGVQAFRKESPFSPLQSKWLWFWIAVFVVCLLLAFGRYAPFYRWLYALPYFSTIRNPAKFTHLLSFALVVMFAYGVDGLWRGYVESTDGRGAKPWSGFWSWWSKASKFERRWVQGCLLLFGLAGVGWVVFALCREPLRQYLQSVQFNESAAQEIANFSVQQPGWFVLFFVLATGLMALLLSGAFRARVGWAAAVLGVLIAADLWRANQPWIIWWNYDQKYSSNPVFDLLRDKPYEHRMAMITFDVPPDLQILQNLYKIEWSQHALPYYNIQSLDIVQLPRQPEDMVAYEKAFDSEDQAERARLATRKWELTNTRYMLGVAESVESLNRQMDPLKRRFRIASRFRLFAKPGVRRVENLEQITAEFDTNAPFALYEFAGALPRAKLYRNWQVATNAASALSQIASPAFEPQQSVVITGGDLPGSPAGGTNESAGSVEYVRYSSKDVLLKSDAPSETVLLLNDRYDPNWKVLVDGKSENLLRCNYMMRGVHLAPGQHNVEFRFEPPYGTLKVSSAGVGLGVVLLGALVATARRRAIDPMPPPRKSAVAKAPSKVDRGQPVAQVSRNGR